MNHNNFAEAMRKLGDPEKSGANQYFVMSQPQNVWFVAHGYIDVFSVQIDNNQPLGSRVFLFTAHKDELLFGMRSFQFGNEQGMLAVPSVDAEIIMTNISEINELMRQPEYIDTLVLLIDTWIDHLVFGISKDLKPHIDRLIENTSEFNMEDNMKFRSKKDVFWVSFSSGNALFLGMKEIMEVGDKSKFPISQYSWLQTTKPSNIKSLTTREIILQDDFWKNLENFYETIFYCDFFNNSQIAVDEHNRLQEKSVHNTSIRTSALLKIASVINNNLRKRYIEVDEEPLLTACKFIAEYSGISIVPPPKHKSEDSTPLTINDISCTSRFRTRKVKLDRQWWKHENGPLLAFTKEGNFPVALVPKSVGKYEYISPSEQLRESVTAQIASNLAVEAYQFYRPFPDHPINIFHLLKFGFRSCTKDITLMILIGSAGGLLTILIPILTGYIFDEVIPRSDYRQLYVFSLVVFCSIIAITIFQLVRSFSMIRIETKLDLLLQSAIWDRLISLPTQFFRKYQAGELAAKTNSIMILRKVLTETVIYSVLGSIFLVFNFVLMFFYDPFLSVSILGFSLISWFFIYFIGKKIQKRQKVIIILTNKIFGMMIQMFSSISKIRIAGAEIHAFAQWADKYAKNKRQTYEVRKLYQWVMVLSTFWPLMITLFVFAVIAHQIPKTMSTGEFMAFYTAMTITVASFIQLGMAGIAYFMAIPLLDSIRPILEALPENVSIKADIQDLKGEIELSNVSFKYNHDLPLALDNVSLKIKPGEFVAIVGASGSGKSTLLRLLLGFESPEIGSVFFDQQDLSSFNPDSVRRQAGTVLQQNQLAPGNILTNIIGMTDATFEDAWEAARNVGLDQEIKKMPMGMYTVISGGLSTLSEGQRQRIMIARAIVKKPRFLFFDEATSSLDNNTQKIVSKSLQKLQVTRVIIAHRLSSIEHADKIYLLERGKIMETGSYTELIKKEGKFCELVKRQLI